jgi:hypothetical protein
MILLILVSLGAAAHAYMFGRWLFFRGNKAGALLAYIIAVVAVALPVYRWLTAP